MKLSVRKASGKTYISGAMTDISFLLIIFFLITAVFVSDRGLVLSLPDKTTPPVEIDSSKSLLVEIKGEGIYSVDGRTVAGETLQKAIHSELSARNDAVVIINVAPDISYQETLAVLQTAKQSGGNRFSLVVEKTHPVPVDLDFGAGK